MRTLGILIGVSIALSFPALAKDLNRLEFEAHCKAILVAEIGDVSVKAVDWRDGADFIFSPDGRYVVAKSKTEVFLHDGITGEFLKTIGSQREGFFFNHAEFSRDSRYLALSSETTGDVHVYDVTTGQIISKLLAPNDTDHKNSLVKFLGSEKIIVLNPTGSLRVYELGGNLLQDLPVTPHATRGVNFATTSDGSGFALAIRAQDDGNYLTAVYNQDVSGNFGRTHLIEDFPKGTTPTLPGKDEITEYHPYISGVALNGKGDEQVLTVNWGNSGRSLGYNLGTRRVLFDTAAGSMVLTREGAILSAPVPISISSDGSKMGRVTFIDPLLSGRTSRPGSSPYLFELFDSRTGNRSAEFQPVAHWDSLGNSKINVMPEVMDGGISAGGNRVVLLYPGKLMHERFGILDLHTPESPRLLSQPILLPNGIEEAANFSPDGNRLLLRPNLGWPLIIDLSNVK